jgi:hypothetical protein
MLKLVADEVGHQCQREPELMNEYERALGD